MRLQASLFAFFAPPLIVHVAASATTTRGSTIDRADGEANRVVAAGLRGSGSGGGPSSSSETDEPSFELSSDPSLLIDIARSGLDRSLSYVHVESEFNYPLTSEQLDAISNYIARYSADGNDDGTNVCPYDDTYVDYDYEGREDTSPENSEKNLRGQDDGHQGIEDHQSIAHIINNDNNNNSGRSLQMNMDHTMMHYVESMCNMMIDAAPCVDWSTWITGTSYSSEVKIPCGECVTLNASPGQALHGETLNFEHGLNIVGKLVIPNDADVTLLTKYVFVQGQLIMPSPVAATEGISNEVSGNQVKFTLYGNDNIMFKADNATDNTHLEMKDVSSKAFVVAGGKVDIRAMDPACPSWVKLQSVTYGQPFPNIALNKVATQVSTFQAAVDGPEQALDGNENSFTHTTCNIAQPWWEVDLSNVYTIASLHIVNRLDCCGGRLHDFDIKFLDENKVEVDSIYSQGVMGDRKTFSTDYVNARYVKIQLRDTDCLQLGEVEVYGWLASDPIPIESLDVLTLGEDAARCWSKPGSRLVLTSDTYNWDDAHVAVVADAPAAAASSLPSGAVYVLPMAKKKTAADDTFGYPDFAVEVALLDRSLVIEGAVEETGSVYEKIGGHFIFLHSPHIHQHLEGALLQNMGQQGRLGRYPLHFHMSECVMGSTLAKNFIYKSNQRCIVVHGSHNVTIRENVAFDTKGHCFMLEDGGEWDNQFLYNLGVKTGKLPKDIIRPGETDHFPSTFWITNPSSDWVGNVAAGSDGPGFWFELKLRAPSSTLEINQGVNPKYLPLGRFDDNTAHSNNFRAGITTYETGYLAPPGTTWNNIKSFKNKGSGLFQHGTSNIILNGGLLADNREAARNFHHEWAVYDGVEFIGRSQHVQSMIDQGRLSAQCDQAGGISIQPNEGLGHGTTIKNSFFSGFDVGCTGGKNAGIFVENDQVRNAVFDAAPTLVNNTFGASDTPIHACNSIDSSPDGWVRYIAIEDPDGSMSRSGPGFYVQDEPPIMNFIGSPESCQALQGCLRFCPGACLRLGIVSISQDYTTRGFKMHIQDGAKSAIVERGPIWFDEKQNHLSAQIPLVLPAPTSDTKYSISFTDGNDQPAWPGYANINLEQEPACTGGLVDVSQVDLVMPAPDDRCDNLFRLDDYPAGIHGWQNFFSGIDVSQEAGGGSFVISTNRRKSDRGHVNLSRTLDASCIAQLGGRTYTVFGKIRITDADGNYVLTDGTSNLSPKVTFAVDGVMSQSWFLTTSADGSWTEFSRDISLPVDSSSAWRAQIIIDQAEKREFHIKDWGMILTASATPTESPSKSPTLSPTTPKPTGSPTPLPTSSPIVPVPVTGSPTGNPVTASPVSTTPTNLALNGFASADSECWAGWARKAIDGNPSSINHSCCSNFGAWLMVDLGKDSLNYIDNITIKNRADCCGGRLKRFYVEVLDSAKDVVFSQYHYGTVGNGEIRTFTVNNGTTGRFVRVRHEDSLKDCLTIGEVEVWGYPVSLPANPPDVVEMALNRPATSSSVFGGLSASNGNDGNFNNQFHTQCDSPPWWKVDLGVESFIQDVVITNRKDCCGGRLKNALVEILNSDGNLVESRPIVGSVGNGEVVQKVFNEDTSFGRYVRVSMNHNDCLHLAEVQVNGYHTMALP